jgi:isopenicillin-N epimerase
MQEERSKVNTLSRQEFLKVGGAGLAAGVLVGIGGAEVYERVGGATTPQSGNDGVNGNPSTDLPDDLYGNWDAVRKQFEIKRDRIHMASFLLASHPGPVRDAIETHRRGLDENPVEYFDNHTDQESVVSAAASEYLEASPGNIALTDSTTMGLGLLYGGLRLREDQEILTTVHDHYATANSLRLRAEKTGATVLPISLYQDLATVSKDEIVESLMKSVRPQTRVLAVTWVHSSTGLKLPISEIAQALAEINQDREEADRALLCVDGVHGLGVENLSVEDLGCDFFVAGCHKWLFGPRGTGLVLGKPEAWPATSPTIPTFGGNAFEEWTSADSYEDWWDSDTDKQVTTSGGMTPGGYHSFEHRWALDQAFRFHQKIGKSLISERIHEQNRQLKEGLAKMSHVTLRTPMDDELSAGIVCFEVNGLSTGEVVGRLKEQGIVGSGSPYHTNYVRLAPSLLTFPEDVDQALHEVQNLAR